MCQSLLSLGSYHLSLPQFPILLNVWTCEPTCPPPFSILSHLHFQGLLFLSNFTITDIFDIFETRIDSRFFLSFILQIIIITRTSSPFRFRRKDQIRRESVWKWETADSQKTFHVFWLAEKFISFSLFYCHLSTVLFWRDSIKKRTVF